MKGTEKQIAWAEDIKATYMERTSEYTEYLKKVAETEAMQTKSYLYNNWLQAIQSIL